MPTENHAREAIRARDDLRDANEKLVLALMRETDRADRAESRETQLRDIAAFRERLIGIVGHDLRNPLNAITVGAQLLLGSGRLAGAEADLATHILGASRRMKRIIVQLLEFTRAHLGGGFVLDRAPTDLGDVCRRICDELRLATGRQIDVVEEGEISGLWDAELLGEVFSNIVGNAVQHAAPGTTIEVELTRDGDSARATVANAGHPIAPELLGSLFEPFRRGSADSERDVGHLGLGLYIANEVVRAHGGRIDVVSAEGRTAFTMTLP